MAVIRQRIAEIATGVVTWAGRVLALIGGFEQVVIHGANPNPYALAFCGALLAGVETFRLIALRIVDRTFDALSGPEQRETPGPPPASQPSSSSEAQP